MGDNLVPVDRELSRQDDSKGLHPNQANNYIDACLDEVDDRSKSKPYELCTKSELPWLSEEKLFLMSFAML